MYLKKGQRVNANGSMSLFIRSNDVKQNCRKYTVIKRSYKDSLKRQPTVSSYSVKHLSKMRARMSIDSKSSKLPVCRSL